MADNATKTIMITGGMGFIGAAAAHNAVNRGYKVVIADTGHDPYRVKYWLTPERIAAHVTFAHLDVTDYRAVLGTIRLHNVTNVVHLAGLQIPQYKADPLLGTRVNVLGTQHILQASRELSGQIEGISIASSVAAEGATPGSKPTTLYGVSKDAGEGFARVYAADYGVGSVSLEPYVVYGKGRDLGVTSALTKASLAAVLGRKYHIPFGGQVVVQDVRFVADCFLAGAFLYTQDAHVLKVGGEAVTVQAFVEMVRATSTIDVDVTWDDDKPLPFEPYESDAGLRRVLGAALADSRPTLGAMLSTHQQGFRELLRVGAIDPKQLET